MTKRERELTKQWIENWKFLGPELDQLRRKEVAAADNFIGLQQLEDAYQAAARDLPPRESSGLVEMQRWFAKLPR